jgi:cell division protein FtsI (penicillin-binding protein 3)
MRLGAEKLYEALRSYGFGTKTGFPVTGEALGLLKATDQWSKVTVPMLSFGQEIGITALQLTQAFSALANDGELMDPQIIKEICQVRSKKTLYRFKPRLIRRVFSGKSNRKVQKMLEEVVRFGTGKKAEISGVAVAGKTGTAQKVDPATGKYSSTKVVVSFCGFLPSPKARLAICVVIDEPTKPKVAWASDIAAPIFKAIAEDAMNVFSLDIQTAEYYENQKS